MRQPRVLTVLGAALVLSLSACGEPGSAGGGGAEPAETTTAVAGGGGGATCDPVAGDQLVVLEDDKGLQTADNIIPAINSAASQPAMVAALDAVSAALDTDKLIELNRQVDVDRRTSPEAAAAFFEEEGIEVTDTSGSGNVVIGAANFSESATLAELFALALTEAGYTTEVRTIGNRETYLPALQSGELTVVPEYLGTLTEFLNKSVNGADAEPVASADVESTAEALRGLGEEAGLTFGEPSEAADQNAFAVTTAFAEEYGVETLSELAEACGGGVVLGGPVECPDRPFCQPGLEETYGLTISEFVSLDAGGPLTKQAITSGEVSLGLVFSSDAALAHEG